MKEKPEEIEVETETPEVEEEEKETSPENSGVKVPESFQQECHNLVSSCESKACLDYLSNLVNEKRMEMDKPEKEFSTEDMPKD